MFVKAKMDDMSKANPHLKDLNLQNIATEELSVEDDHLFPKAPLFFKIVSLKGIENGTILLEIKAEFTPTAVCGDGCAVNLKGSRLLERKYGIKSPFSRCASHSSYGTIRRMCTSERSGQQDAKNLYENLRKLLKHFAMSPKSTELLNNALSAVEMNDIIF